MKRLMSCAVLALGVLTAGAGQVRAAGGDVLGSAGFVPTAERPVGWRGDGTGRFVGATPPLEWSVEADGKGKNLLWRTQLPMYSGGSGASQPIVVGDKVFFEVGPKDGSLGPEDLYCLSLTTGKILWIRALTAYDGAPEADRKQVESVVEPLQKELTVLNAQLAETLNKNGLNQDNWRGDVRQKRVDVGSKINGAMAGVDKTKYKMGGRFDWGYASATPCSDGKNVYVWYGNRIAACFDLAGQLVWATVEPGVPQDGGEHGNHASPILLPDRMVVVCGKLVQAFDKKTGKTLWQQAAQNAWGIGYSSLNAAKLEDGWVLVMAHGQGFRADTGKSLWGAFQPYHGENTTPVLDGHTLVTYERSGIRTFKLPATVEGGGMKEAGGIRQKDQFGEYQIGSPIVDDGLVYGASDHALLHVVDPLADGGKGATVYDQQLELRVNDKPWVGNPGLSSSPAIAGKHLFVMDNSGTTVVLELGRTFKQVAKNTVVSKDMFVASQVFCGDKVLMRGQAGIYCFGGK